MTWLGQSNCLSCGRRCADAWCPRCEAAHDETLIDRGFEPGEGEWLESIASDELAECEA